MQRTYELMFIVRPDMPEEEQDKLIANLESQVGNAGGTIKSVERMGKRRLAYMVRRFQDGIYVLMVLEGEGGMVKEVERRLRVNEPVIKFMTVRIDEEQKRLAKVKAIRDTKVRGKGTRAAAEAAAAESAAAAAAESAAAAAAAEEAPAAAPAEGAESTPVTA
jgi:small subunit ribosomal protein S6